MIPQNSPFFKLPSEIITSILENLSLHGLVTCKQTCKKFKELYDSSSQLQYIAELEIAGMKDNPYCSMSVSERLESLRKREDAWAALQPDFSATIAIPKAPAGIYDVTPNTYLLGVAAIPNEILTLGIQSITLPSNADEALAAPSVVYMTKHIVDFGTSIEEHDLLAAVTIASTPDHRLFALELTLFRHSTGTLHDQAEKPVIRLMQVDTMVSISIEISGENLAIIVSARDGGGPDELHIFNWKKGTRKGDPMPAPNLGLCYLREDLLLMPEIESHTLAIMHIPHSIPGVDDKDLPISLITQLALPPLAPGQRIAYVQCRCDPSPTAGDEYPQYSPKNRPFFNDPRCAIMVMEMVFFGLEARKSYLAFMHRSTLLDLLPGGWESKIKLPEPKATSESASSRERAPESVQEAVHDSPPSDDSSSEAPPQPEPSSSEPASTQPPNSIPTDQGAPEESNAEPTNALGAEGAQDYADEAVVTLLNQDDDDDDGGGDDGDDDDDDYEDEDEDDGGDVDDHDSFYSAEDHEDLPSAQELGISLNNEALAWNTVTDGIMYPILNTPGNTLGLMQDGECALDGGTYIPPIVDWSDWGPRTRWLDATKFASVYITSTAGQRFVRIDKNSRTQNSPIRILDFNPYHVRKAHLSNERYLCTDRIVGVGPEELQDESERCLSGGVFTEDIVSRLPYIESSTEKYHGYDAVLLDEQRIIGIINAGPEEFSSVKDIAILHYG
ncbi:hypothetical protein H1R20_g12114, partial [Candolleomyces eurysporus]